MTLGVVGLIKFLDAQVRNAAEDTFYPNEQDVDFVSSSGLVHYQYISSGLLVLCRKSLVQIL